MDELAWLIEIPTQDGAKWFTVNRNFTADAAEAIRFCRKVDAETVLDFMGLHSLDAFASEHMFYA